MRVELKVLRIRHGLSREEMAKRCGVNFSTYSAIEAGSRNGRPCFWEQIQKSFNIPDCDMWKLMKNN